MHSLRRHCMTVHKVGGKTWYCAICAFQAYRRDHLRNHYIRAHKFNECFLCPICGEKHLNLIAHITDIHPAPLGGEMVVPNVQSGAAPEVTAGNMIGTRNVPRNVAPDDVMCTGLVMPPVLSGAAMPRIQSNADHVMPRVQSDADHDMRGIGAESWPSDI